MQLSVLIVQLHLIFQHCFLHYKADLFVGGESKTRLLIIILSAMKELDALGWQEKWKTNAKIQQVINHVEFYSRSIGLAAKLPPAAGSNILLLSYDCQSSFAERTA
jgi:hypothetical protein